MSIVENVLDSVPHWVVYGAAFAFPFAEAGFLLGFVLPGETAIVFGGVLAGRHQVSLGLVLGLAIAGAILGDFLGYEVGRKYGKGLQQTRLGRKVGEQRWESAEGFLQRRGGPAVLIGRFTALLRALVPGAAGMAKLPYRTFVVWNSIGGAAWATLCVIGGWAVGDAISTYLANAGYVLVGLVVVFVAVHLVRRRRSTNAPSPH